MCQGTHARLMLLGPSIVFIFGQTRPCGSLAVVPRPVGPLSSPASRVRAPRFEPFRLVPFSACAPRTLGLLAVSFAVPLSSDHIPRCRASCEPFRPSSSPVASAHRASVHCARGAAYRA